MEEYVYACPFRDTVRLSRIFIVLSGVKESAMLRIRIFVLNIIIFA